MSAVVTFDGNTGEVIDDSLPVPVFVIPADKDEMVADCNQSQRAAFGHHWRTAAQVYAWTEDGQGRRTDLGEKSAKLTLTQFAELGVRGLGDRGTVAKYRSAMQRAIEEGLCDEPKRGEPFSVPRVEFALLANKPANYSSESNEWYTPEKYIDSVRAVLGCIDLDPATCEFANRTVQAAHIFTIEDDSLKLQWFGRVFLNPPYGKKEGDSQAGLFCNKAIAEYKAGRVTECIILVNSVHSQKWQSPVYEFPICFVDHRIEFVNATGQSNENPTFQNIFIYLGENVAGFAREFSKHGYCLEPIR